MYDSYHTLIRQIVNVVQFTTRFLVPAILLSTIAGCAANPIDTLPPWTILRVINDVPPQEQVALTLHKNGVWLAWPGDATMPNLRLVEATTPTDPAVLPLGITPRALSLYSMADGWMQFLWLDQKLPGEFFLVGGTLNKDGTLERGPTEISNEPALHYNAVRTPIGEVIAFWVRAGSGPTPIYAQVIDSLGRPHQALQIASSGHYPAAAFDQKGDLHLAWLDAGPPWAIHYATFPGGKLTVPESTTIGIIPVEPGQALEQFTMGLDETHIYCLWGVVRVGEEMTGTVSALIFPRGNPISTRTFVVNIPDVISVRWPTVPVRVMQTMNVGVIGSTQKGWEGIPFVLTITPDGIMASNLIISRPVPISRISIASDAEGNLHLAWAVYAENGISQIYYASNRPLAR
jgi:hypothetical protein